MSRNDSGSVVFGPGEKIGKMLSGAFVPPLWQSPTTAIVAWEYFPRSCFAEKKIVLFAIAPQLLLWAEMAQGGNKSSEKKKIFSQHCCFFSLMQKTRKKVNGQ